MEARRALPEALRMKEDTERAKKSREEKQKGQQGKSSFSSSALSLADSSRLQSSCRSTITRELSTR